MNTDKTKAEVGSRKAETQINYQDTKKQRKQMDAETFNIEHLPRHRMSGFTPNTEEAKDDNRRRFRAEPNAAVRNDGSA